MGERKIFLILIILFTVIISGFSQNYKILNFEEFEPYLQKRDEKVYVINFWATWCKPCVEEIPSFNKLYSSYKNKNVEILMVSLDFGKNLESRILTFQKKHNIKANIIILDDPDSNSWIDKVSPEWSGAIPATIIYNKDRMMFYEQSFNFEDLEKELLKFL